MIDTWKTTIWRQFGAAIDMLENAIRECPDKVWGNKAGFQEFWYMVFHTLFWLDYYLSETKEGFQPPAPYTLSEFDPEGAFPNRVYTKDEMLTYLEYGRNKFKDRISRLTEETAHRIVDQHRRELTQLEMLLYNMRHVQHHCAQLNLLLRQSIDSAPGWVSIAKTELTSE